MPTVHALMGREDPTAVTKASLEAELRQMVKQNEDSAGSACDSGD